MEREHACLFSKERETWCAEVTTQYHSPMQQAPKANRHKNRSQHAHSPFSPSLHLLSLSVASLDSLSLECDVYTDARAAGAPASLQRFLAVCRSSVAV